jgi:hypothetical protein
VGGRRSIPRRPSGGLAALRGRRKLESVGVGGGPSGGLILVGPPKPAEVASPQAPAMAYVIVAE